MPSREGFDLLHKYGRRHLWRRIMRDDFRSIIWRDTFGRFECMVRGHKLATGRAHDSGNGQWPCFRCNKFIAAARTNGGSYV